MDDAELDQQIEELQRRLTELRREQRGRYPPAPDWKRPTGQDAPEGATEGTPFMVHSATDLELAALPDLARLILDALPVQVYIKKAQIEENGRQYTYLNEAARGVYKIGRRFSNQPEEGVRQYDRDVFPDEDPSSGELYQKMQDQETATIGIGRSRVTTTDWKQSLSRWTRNTNIEIPILDFDGTSIGFCSIAHDLVFKELPKEWAIYQMKIQHHFNNLMVALTNPLNRANALLAQLMSETAVDADSLKGVQAHLKLIEQTLAIAHRTSKIQIEALESLGSTGEWQSADEVAAAIDSAYKDSWFDFTGCRVSEEAKKAPLLHPRAVKAILTVLVNNAVKYSKAPSGRAECRVQCDVRDRTVVWEVSNPCQAITGHLEMDFSGRPSLQEVMERGFDGLMIWTLVNYGIPGKKAEEMIDFPKTLQNGWITVRLFAEVAPDAETRH
jgi:hypothetical protein